MPKFSNPVLYEYRGEKVRKYNTVFIRVSASEMQRFIDARIDSGMSARSAIQSLGILCPCTMVITKSSYAAGNGKVT